MTVVNWFKDLGKRICDDLTVLVAFILIGIFAVFCLFLFGIVLIPSLIVLAVVLVIAIISALFDR